MTLSRLITWMCGINERAIDALAPVERAQLAAQCRRLLVAAEAAPREPEGVLRKLQAGERSL